MKDNLDNLIRLLQNKDWWTDKCLNNLYFLCRNVLMTLEDATPGYKDLYKPTHQMLCDFVVKYTVPGNRLLILLPRGWIKSYIITIGWVIQRVLRNLIAGYREHFVISNAILSNSELFLDKIKYNLKYNDLLKNFFKDYLPDYPDEQAERWTLSEIQILGNKIETGSVERSLVSRHYKVMIHDDLVSKENSETALQTEKIVDWWKLARSLLHPQGIEIVIGTRWSFDDVYGHIIETFLNPPKDYAYGKPIVELHEGNFHLLQVNCWQDPINKTGSTFPILFPEEKLKQTEKEQAERFPGQYCNDPLEMGTNPFRMKWFKYFADAELPEVRYTMMLVDPSGRAKETSDFSGISILESATDKKIYVRFAERKLVTDMKLAHWITDVALQYQPATIGVEDSKFNVMVEMLEYLIPQLVKMKLIPEHLVQYAYTLPYICQELNPHGRPKEVRIKNLSSYIESGNLLFPKDKSEDVIEEFVRFPQWHKDDIIDAMAYVFDLLVFPKADDPVKTLIVPEHLKLTKEEKEQKEWEQYIEEVYLGQPLITEEDIY